MSNIDRKCINTIPYNTDTSRMLRVLPMKCTGLNVLLYASNCKRGRIPRIMLVNNYERRVNSTRDLIQIEIKEQVDLLDMNRINIEEKDLIQLKHWIETYHDLLLKYWNCEIEYSILYNQIFSRKQKLDKQKRVQEKIRKARLKKEQELLAAKQEEREAKAAAKAEQEKKRKMCYEKKAYSTLEAARKAVKKCRRERGVQTYVYMCPLCGSYHITSHPKKYNVYV